MWLRGTEIFAEVCLPDSQQRDASRYGMHPALLDAALHPMALITHTGADAVGTGHSRMAFAWNGLSLYAAGASTLRVRLTAPSPDTVSLVAVDEIGSLVASVDSISMRPVSAEQLMKATSAAHADSLYRVDWVPAPDVAPAQGGWWAVAGDNSGRWLRRTPSGRRPGDAYPDLKTRPRTAPKARCLTW